MRLTLYREFESPPVRCYLGVARIARHAEVFAYRAESCGKQHDLQS
jgi:hypothetical protein